MKLIKHDHSQMIFEKSSKTQGSPINTLVYAVFIAMPLFLAFMVAKESGSLNISCDRQRWNQVNCQITKSQFFGLVPEESVKAEGIISANQKDDYIAPSGSGNAKVVISTTKGEVTYGEGKFFIAGMKGNLSETLLVAGVINEFVGSRQMQVVISRDQSLQPENFIVPIIITIFFITGLAGFYFTFQTQTLILDRDQNKIIRHNFLLGKKIYQKSFPLENACQITIKYHRDDNDYTYFTPTIELTSGGKFPLETLAYIELATIEANKIRQFLQLPTET